jgi:hypothetical protein
MHCQRQGHKKHEPGLEVESAGATKSNRVVSVQTHMRRANLDDMFAPLLASGWINQPHAQTPLQQLMLKSEKYFMKLISPAERKNRPSVPLVWPSTFPFLAHKGRRPYPDIFRRREA